MMFGLVMVGPSILEPFRLYPSGPTRKNAVGATCGGTKENSNYVLSVN